MKIKFKNGYSVEVNDSYLKTMSKREIIDRAKKVVDELCSDADNDEPMVIVKKVKTPKGYKIMIIKNNTVSGVKRFDLDAEEEAQDFYDRLADKYNLDEEGYDDFGRTKIAAPAKYFQMQKIEDSVKRKTIKTKKDSKKIKDMFEPIETFKTFEFLGNTKNGLKVVEAYEDLDDGRMHVICYRPSDKTYIIGLGYNADTGVWNQGRYDYRNFSDAEKMLKQDYNVDIYEPDLTVFEGKTQIEDTPINFTEELGFAITPTAINKLVSKKNGQALNPSALKKALNYLETDLDYDIEVRAPKWIDPKNKTTDPRVVEAIISKYGEFVNELNKIDDDRFNDKAQEIIEKVEVLTNIAYNMDDTGPDIVEEKEVVEEPATKVEPKSVKETVIEKKVEEQPVIKLSGKKKEIPLDEEDEDETYVEDGCKDSDVDDVYVEDGPVAGETIHASVEGAPDHSFNKNILVRGNSRALSANETDAAYGRRLLSGEYEDVKQTLLYDIAHAGEVAAVTPKYLLHMGMEKYKEIIDLYNVPGLEREYAELMKLYNRLFYNGYYLGVRGN